MSEKTVLRTKILDSLGIGPSRFPLIIDNSIGYSKSGRKRFISLGLSLFTEPTEIRFSYPWSFNKPFYIRETRRRCRVNLVKHTYLHINWIRRRIADQLSVPPLVLATFNEMEKHHSIDQLISNPKCLHSLVLFVNSREFEVSNHGRKIEDEDGLAFPVSVEALFKEITSQTTAHIQTKDPSFPGLNLLQKTCSIPFQIAATRIAISDGFKYRSLNQLLESVIDDPDNPRDTPLWELFARIAFSRDGFPILEVVPEAVINEVTNWIDTPKTIDLINPLVETMTERQGKLSRLWRKNRSQKVNYTSITSSAFWGLLDVSDNQ